MGIGGDDYSHRSPQRSSLRELSQSRREAALHPLASQHLEEMVQARAHQLAGAGGADRLHQSPHLDPEFGGQGLQAASNGAALNSSSALKAAASLSRGMRAAALRALARVSASTGTASSGAK